MSKDGDALQSLPFDKFLVHMQRYEAGERELNQEEKDLIAFLSEGGTARQYLPFEIFLENMKRYNQESEVTKHR